MASRIYLALILVFIAAAGTRLAFLHFAASGTFSNPDTAGYQGLADSLLSNWTYATDKAAGAPGGFPADLQRPPGYPFFLYLISPWSGVNRAWVAFVQSMLVGTPDRYRRLKRKRRWPMRLGRSFVRGGLPFSNKPSLGLPEPVWGPAARRFS